MPLLVATLCTIMSHMISVSVCDIFKSNVSHIQQEAMATEPKKRRIDSSSSTMATPSSAAAAATNSNGNDDGPVIPEVGDSASPLPA